ncbi:MAG: hypothetical protein KAS32_31160 [Candidatus Peribacteraceae bacterium]|nr:hypothetical protein [Candidatus Peribacteraceae bacterium]
MYTSHIFFIESMHFQALEEMSKLVKLTLSKKNLSDLQSKARKAYKEAKRMHDAGVRTPNSARIIAGWKHKVEHLGKKIEQYGAAINREKAVVAA